MTSYSTCPQTHSHDHHGVKICPPPLLTLMMRNRILSLLWFHHSRWQMGDLCWDFCLFDLHLIRVAGRNVSATLGDDVIRLCGRVGCCQCEGPRKCWSPCGFSCAACDAICEHLLLSFLQSQNVDGNIYKMALIIWISGYRLVIKLIRDSKG